MSEPESIVTVDSRDHILLIGLNRPAKRNTFDEDLINALGRAYGRLEDESEAWVGVLFAHGDHFTGGLDLAQTAGWISEGRARHISADTVDPWGLVGRPRTKPLVAATQGWCLTAGVELLLASDIRIAAS